MLVSASSSYGQLKAKALADMCAKDVATAQSSSDAFDALTCSAYVSGWMHGIGGMMIQKDGRYFIIDFAEGVTTKQLVRVFVKHIKEHPEEEIKGADVGLVDAAAAARLFTFASVQ
jgi:Rap1a immunity proteins